MNRLLFILLVFPAFVSCGFSQQLHVFDLFTAQLQDTTLVVKDNGGKTILQMEFNNPQDFAVDLDNDRVKEYIVVDSAGVPNLPSYTIYIFSTIDIFTLEDSLASGTFEPYVTFSTEEGGEIIVTGNKDFEFFDQENSDIYLPINCWRYDNGELFLVNDDIYDLFMEENYEILNYLDYYYESAVYDCKLSRKLQSAISAAYVNYMNAGEVTLASKFIKKYYPCGDINRFIEKINETFNPGAADENGME